MQQTNTCNGFLVKHPNLMVVSALIICIARVLEVQLIYVNIFFGFPVNFGLLHYWARGSNKKLWRLERAGSKSQKNCWRHFWMAPYNLQLEKNAHKIALKWLFSFCCKDAKICTKIWHVKNCFYEHYSPHQNSEKVELEKGRVNLSSYFWNLQIVFSGVLGSHLLQQH